MLRYTKIHKPAVLRPGLIDSKGSLLLQMIRTLRYLGLWMAVAFALTHDGHAISWLPFGPDGGDVRSLAGDPHDPAHIYLGTANGWIYESRNAGTAWTRLALVGRRDDLVLDHIVVDPTDSKHLLVATWALGKPDGGLFISHDAGAHWSNANDLKGQSVLSLAASASDTRVYVAGTLRGVYRTLDAGDHWALISPADSEELHEVESVAVDPADPGVIYAGTWHLPWKTTDGGQNWSNIKEGIIDDSDVFSIIVDPRDPKTIYASACSGIYKSDTAGEQFHKVQGIPSTARRTRVLKQDPNDRNTVFAGTTEGLFRTQNAGADWSRMTDPNVIVNDVYVDPSDSKHVVLATDRGGVLSSRDGGVSFEPTNRGFSARQVTSYAADAQHPGTLYVGVINDKEFGGVFESETGGLSWFQRSGGLEGRDVFSLTQAPDGVLLAGTGHGIFRLEGGAWTRADVVAEEPAPATKAPVAKRVIPEPGSKRPSPGYLPKQSVAGRATTPGKATKRGGKAPQESKPTSQSKAKPKSSSKPKPKSKPKASASHPQTKAKAGKISPQQQSGRPVDKQQRAAVRTPPVTLPKVFDGGTFAFARSADVLYAATLSGLLTSDSAGKSWKPVPGVDAKEWRFVSAAKGVLAVADLRDLRRSGDEGQTWSKLTLPSDLTQINAMAVNDAGEVWVAGLQGIFYLEAGQTDWKPLTGFYIRDVNSVFYDAPSQRMLVTTNAPGRIVLAIHVPDHATTFWDAGWNLRFARSAGDYMLGATLFDGIVVQPRMVDSPAAPEAAHGGLK